ncbi:hypothetical protein A5698_09980 [Mycobacterium sp. E136]|uniref:hypothetical protein n=1 Tax=Mycobacterium sp. E136 TaxID=1834125 RepID=UPI0007FC7815|nr:hypothetical protein [Mycobacterium sp. E136]OBG99431.1 hypothetical protein A5698_09980 [Mycobacterium sp. E136]
MTTAPPRSVIDKPQSEQGRAMTRLAVRQVRRGALMVAAACAAMSAWVASQYQPIGNMLDESGLQALAENSAVRVLSGPPVALDDPGGFTVWRTATPVALLASVWIIFAATHLTRGEEDEGRWELLLAGRLRMADILVRCLAALAASAALIGVAVAMGLLAARTEVTGTLLYAGGITCTALAFAAMAVLAAQTVPWRPGAIGLATAVLGLALALRMIADGSHRFAWFAWATPFGLTTRAAPYAENRILPLVVLIAYPMALGGAAVVAAHRRDLGSGIIAAPVSRPPRTRLLGSVEGFALRRTARSMLWWTTGIAAYFFVAGALLASILDLVETQPRFKELAAAAGTGGDDLANAFAAALFGVLAIATGLYATRRFVVMVADEKAGRLALVLAQPIPRIRLISAETAVIAVGVAALHGSAAVALWCGAVTTGAPVQLNHALAGSTTFIPVALLAVGAAAVGVGWFPSAVGALGALPLVGGYLLNVAAQTTNPPDWVADLSPWTHLTASPDKLFDGLATAILLLIGVGLTALGAYGFVRRDTAN